MYGKADVKDAEGTGNVMSRTSAELVVCFDPGQHSRFTGMRLWHYDLCVCVCVCGSRCPPKRATLERRGFPL